MASKLEKTIEKIYEVVKNLDSKLDNANKETKTKRKQKDPNAPKRPKTAWICFYVDNLKKYKDKEPNLSNQEIQKKMSEDWGKLTPEQKKKYEDEAKQDTLRFEKQNEEYKKSNIKTEVQNSDDDKQKTSKKEAPKKETPKKETSKKETPKKETSKKEKETPKKEAPKKSSKDEDDDIDVNLSDDE